MKKIKPCPFCGVTDIKSWTDDLNNQVIFCRYCGATGPQGATKERAILRWNKRVEEK